MEGVKDILSTNQIRCPYCRNKQNTLLPYYPLDGIKKIHGVNYIDENINKYNSSFVGKCCYKIPNVEFDCTQEESSNNVAYYECPKNNVMKLKEDDKDYCSYHKYLMLKELMKQEKQKQKMIEKMKKEEEKEALKKKKMEEKEALKEEKLKQKDISKQNIILCNSIIKSGKNKGCMCGNKAFENDKCKRHIVKI
jgi:hypothetical protein